MNAVTCGNKNGFGAYTMDRDFNEDIKINENDLEGEWLEQASLFLYYAEAHADAMYLRDRAKSKMEYTYSKLYANVKNNWDKYFDSKPTEAALKEHILSHKKYKEVEKEFIKATKDVNMLLNVKTAFDHRKRALENLVSLRISGFYSEPKNRANKKMEGGGHKTQKTALNRDGSRATSRLSKKRKLK
jgi:hypothetical protein